MKENIILEKAKNGNSKAFETIYKKYEKPVQFYVYSKIGKSEDSEDLVQDIFIKVFRNINSYDENAGSFYNFVLMNAKQVIINYMKRKYVRTNKRDDSDIELIEDKDFNLEETLEDREEKDLLLDLIKNLSENHKTAIKLVYMKGLSYKEAAKVMKESESNFKSILHRAKIELRKQMAKTYPELKDTSYKHIMKIVLILCTSIALLGGLVYAGTKIYEKILAKKEYTISELREDVPDGEAIISREEAKEKICNYLSILGRDVEISTDDLHLIRDYKLNKICWMIKKDNKYLLKINSENGNILEYFNYNNNENTSINLDELFYELDFVKDYEKIGEEVIDNICTIKFAKKYGEIYNNYQSVTVVINSDTIQAIYVLDYPYEDKEVLIPKEQAIEIFKENGVEVNDVELSIEVLGSSNFVLNELYKEIDENNRREEQIYMSRSETRKVWKSEEVNFFVDSNTGEYLEKDSQNIEEKNS